MHLRTLRVGEGACGVWLRNSSDWSTRNFSFFFFLFPSSLPFSSHVSTFMKSRRMNPWTSWKISLELRYYQLAAAHLHFGSRLMSTRCLSLSSYAVAIENSCGSSVRLSSPSKDCQSFSAAIKGKKSQSEIRSGLLLQRNKNTDQNHINVWMQITNESLTAKPHLV